MCKPAGLSHKAYSGALVLVIRGFRATTANIFIFRPWALSPTRLLKYRDVSLASRVCQVPQGLCALGVVLGESQQPPTCLIYIHYRLKTTLNAKQPVSQQQRLSNSLMPQGPGPMPQGPGPMPQGQRCMSASHTYHHPQMQQHKWNLA